MRALILLLLLLSCSSGNIPEINGTAVEKQPIVINEVERVLNVDVEEGIVPTPVSDYTFTEDTISFSNKKHERYIGDTKALHTKEGRDEKHFIINKGHNIILDKSSITYLVSYKGINPLGKTVDFELLLVEPKKIEVKYEEIKQNKTLGKGILEIEELTFPFYIGYKAGNPIAMDMNGDRKIDGTQMIIHTKTGAEHKPKRIY